MSYLKEHDKHVSRSGYSSFSVTYLESHLGSIQIESCDECPYMVVFCEHKFNSWNPDGTQLTCDLCGIDGT